ncbi:MAG: hypothetical protein FJW20_02515 [Acidimicrobiia bacterium]|nr:hypothetical protein [Acidimicrobiia bacterium]
MAMLLQYWGVSSPSPDQLYRSL